MEAATGKIHTAEGHQIMGDIHLSSPLLSHLLLLPVHVGVHGHHGGAALHVGGTVCLVHSLCVAVAHPDCLG